MTKKPEVVVDYINAAALFIMLVLMLTASVCFTGAGYLVFRGALCMVGVTACSTLIAYRYGRWHQNLNKYYEHHNKPLLEVDGEKVLRCDPVEKISQTYTLNCNRCMGAFDSPEGFPDPHLCDNCKEDEG